MPRQPGESDHDREAKANHPSRSDRYPPSTDPRAGDPVNAEVVDLVGRDREATRAGAPADPGATVYPLGSPRQPDSDGAEVYDYEGDGSR
ncbi:MAG: hypothetical protein KDB24_13135, partial [Microthrixaceae bacterium]|nr:hypothetical protein [Microthrixaceae bacterium]